MKNTKKYMYQPGDIVIVRKDLDKYKSYKMFAGPYKDKTWGIHTDMCLMRGQAVHISGIHEYGAYLISETDEFVWTDEMFSGLAYNECCCNSLL